MTINIKMQQAPAMLLMGGCSTAKQLQEAQAITAAHPDQGRPPTLLHKRGDRSSSCLRCLRSGSQSQEQR
jgi:hypothetical protein